mgnify:CR=1 FL=1
MAIVTRALTLNAAFLQEIKEDNRLLRELLAQTSSVFEDLGEGFPPHRDVVDLLWRLRDQLAMHFALEDAYGYFDDAIAEAPRLSQQAEQLRRQHDDLFLQICELVEEAEQLLYGERAEQNRATLAASYRSFHVTFHEHESHENRLILEAFDDDIGVGD